MSTSADRWRTIAGAIVLVVLQLGGVVLATHPGDARPDRSWHIPPATADVLGTVEHLGDGILTLTTSQGLTDVRVDAATQATTLTGPAKVADIRPGDAIVIWGQDPARVILVGGPSS
jgi:hypothetical protein